MLSAPTNGRPRWPPMAVFLSFLHRKVFVFVLPVLLYNIKFFNPYFGGLGAEPPIEKPSSFGLAAAVGAPPCQRKRGGNGDSILQDCSSLLLAAPMRLAHSVSLMRLAAWSSCANARLAFKYCSASDSDFSFSYGVA